MNDSIHPHWKSTTDDASDLPAKDQLDFDSLIDEPLVLDDEEQAEDTSRVESETLSHRIPVTGSGVSFGNRTATLGVFLVGALVLFIFGLNLIRTDLSGQVSDLSRPIDQHIDLYDGIPPRMAMRVGEYVELSNRGTLPQQWISEERSSTDRPMFRSARIDPGESFSFEVPEVLEGMTLTIQNVFDPEHSGTLIVEAGTPGDVPQLPQQPAQPPVPTVPGAGTEPVGPPTSTPFPDLEYPGVPEEETQLDLGEDVSADPDGPWPQGLPINRHTVGNTSVPPLAPTTQLPIHTAAQTYSQIYGRPPALRQSPRVPTPVVHQPATGPALSLFGVLGLSGVLLLRRKSERARTL